MRGPYRYGPEKAIVANFWQDKDGKLWLTNLYTWQECIEEPGKGLLSGYWVDWCKRDQMYLYHMASCGGGFPIVVDGIYWRADGTRIRQDTCHLADKQSRKRNKTRRLRRLPDGFSGDLLEWLGNHGHQEESVWCGICKDDFPGDALCEHCWWCEEYAWYSTPTERHDDCQCEACKEHTAEEVA